VCHLSVQPTLSSSADKDSGGRVVQGQKTGGGSPEIMYGKAVQKTGKGSGVFFQKAVTPPVSNYGCDSDKPET